MCCWTSCRYLYGFEDFCASTGITFRMDLPYKTAEKTSSKSEVNAEETASGGNAVSLSTSSAGEEQKALKEPETFSTQHAAKVLKHRLRVCLIWQTKHTSHAASVLKHWIHNHYLLHPQFYFTYFQIIFKQLYNLSCIYFYFFQSCCKQYTLHTVQ